MGAIRAQAAVRGAVADVRRVPARVIVCGSEQAGLAGPLGGWHAVDASPAGKMCTIASVPDSLTVHAIAYGRGGWVTSSAMAA